MSQSDLVHKFVVRHEAVSVIVLSLSVLLMRVTTMLTERAMDAGFICI